MTSASEWIRESNLGKKTIDTVQVSSAIKAGCSNVNRIVDRYLGYLLIKANNVQSNNQNVGLYSTATSNRGGVSLDDANFMKGVTLFTARKSIKGNWINDKDEYMKPNTDIDTNNYTYQQWNNDCIVYSLFNNSSQQSSLRQVDYKGKKWDIDNQFYWMSIDEMKKLAIDNNYVAMIEDTKWFPNNTYVYNLLQETELSDDAQQVMDTASSLVQLSFPLRENYNEEHPQQQLQCWNAGWAQLKPLLKLHFKEEYKDFVELYKRFEDRMRPWVYTFGFLRK